jgi:sulfotransferase
VLYNSTKEFQLKKYHFISGLPRSGTTLLSTILKQNPKFEASVSGPLARFTRAIIQESSSQGGYRFECPPEKRKQLINGLFENYYDDPTKEVAFNTNRGWPLLLPTIKDLYPESKMILCVRDIGWILDSFEMLQRKNPYTFTSMFSDAERINVYSRCETLLNNARTLGFAYASVKEAITSEYKSSIMVVDYIQLAKDPARTMRALYSFIGEEYYQHDFDNVEASYDEFDEDIQLPGLHTTRKKVQYIERDTVIPPDIWQRVNGMEVWK